MATSADDLQRLLSKGGGKLQAVIADAAGRVDNNEECWDASLHTQWAHDDGTIHYDCLRAARASSRELYAKLQ